MTGGSPGEYENGSGAGRLLCRVVAVLVLSGPSFDVLLPMVRWCRDEGVGYFQVRPVLGLPFEMARTAACRGQPRPDWGRLRADLQAAEGLSTPAFRVAVSWDKFEDV